MSSSLIDDNWELIMEYLPYHNQRNLTLAQRKFQRYFIQNNAEMVSDIKWLQDSINDILLENSDINHKILQKLNKIYKKWRLHSYYLHFQ